MYTKCDSQNPNWLWSIDHDVAAITMDDVVTGFCDLCGEPSDGTTSECNLLSCSFAHCSDILYHQVRVIRADCMLGAFATRRLLVQACLDKFFRSNKLDKSRKTGFKCPRGCGKDSKHASPCPGRVRLEMI